MKAKIWVERKADRINIQKSIWHYCRHLLTDINEHYPGSGNKNTFPPPTSSYKMKSNLE